MELALQMTVTELNAFLADAFEEPRPYVVERLEPGLAVATMSSADVTVRPGGTVSGPTQMMLADAAAYAVVLAHIGPVALAVTSSLTINFLRKPRPVGLRAEAEILKLGRTLAVVDVRLFSDGGPEVVAQSGVTYAIPSQPSTQRA
jgi:uncharacterized protein (TIGR00369 family)